MSSADGESREVEDHSSLVCDHFDCNKEQHSLCKKDGCQCKLCYDHAMCNDACENHNHFISKLTKVTSQATNEADFGVFPGLVQEVFAFGSEVLLGEETSDKHRTERAVEVEVSQDTTSQLIPINIPPEGIESLQQGERFVLDLIPDMLLGPSCSNNQLGNADHNTTPTGNVDTDEVIQQADTDEVIQPEMFRV